MINIQIFLFGIYRNGLSDYDPESGIVLHLERDLSIDDLLKTLFVSIDYAMVYINAERVRTNALDKLNEGDVVKIFSPVCGG